MREEQQALSEAAIEDGDYMASMMALWTTPFMPNLLNTSVFLVQTSQSIAVLLVNYKGRPFMKGISENHPLFLSVFACVAGCVCCAWGVFPEINTMIHLEPFPDDGGLTLTLALHPRPRRHPSPFNLTLSPAHLSPLTLHASPSPSPSPSPLTLTLTLTSSLCGASPCAQPTASR